MNNYGIKMYKVELIIMNLNEHSLDVLPKPVPKKTVYFSRLPIKGEFIHYEDYILKVKEVTHYPIKEIEDSENILARIFCKRML